MGIRRFARGCAMLVIALIASAEYAYAARIYNKTTIDVAVRGGPNHVSLAPGQTSDSLSWTSQGYITVSTGVYQICNIFTAPHSVMVGGNYMVITQADREIRCYVCDSDHRQMHYAAGRPPDVRPHWSPRQGC
jgi:hypothetical protein